MGWREEREANLEKNLESIVNLLGNYETNLIDTTSPSEQSKITRRISDLKNQMNEYQSQLLSLNSKETNCSSSAISMSGVTYTDIDFVVTALINQNIACTPSTPDNFQPTDPKRKMSKNDLTHEIQYMLIDGLAKAGDVRHFIENIAKINFPYVPERLKASLNTEYAQLVSLGIRGDDLFKKMHSFSHQNNSDYTRQSAGLAVLCYFFETCDVFEP